MGRDPEKARAWLAANPDRVKAYLGRAAAYLQQHMDIAA